MLALEKCNGTYSGLENTRKSHIFSVPSGIANTFKTFWVKFSDS